MYNIINKSAVMNGGKTWEYGEGGENWLNALKMDAPQSSFGISRMKGVRKNKKKRRKKE